MSEDRIDIIERYLSGKMSEEEKARFTEALDTDPELRKDVDNMRLIDDALELSIENDLRRELKDLELDDSGKSRKWKYLCQSVNYHSLVANQLDQDKSHW